MEKYTKKSKAFGIAFLVWFIASFVGLLLFSELEKGSIVVAIFGQYFFVFGLVIIFGAKDKVGFIPLLVGITVLIGAGINIFGTEQIINIFNKKVIFILVSAVFLLVGLGFLIIPRYTENKKKIRCTFPVDAKCIRFNTSYSDDNDRLYSPVWEFYAGGEFRTYCDGMYTNVGLPKEGDSETLYLNPENFDDVYRPTPSTRKMLLTFVGVIVTIVSGAVMYFTVSEFIGYINIR